MKAPTKYECSQSLICCRNSPILIETQPLIQQMIPGESEGMPICIPSGFPKLSALFPAATIETRQPVLWDREIQILRGQVIQCKRI